MKEVIVQIEDSAFENIERDRLIEWIGDGVLDAIEDGDKSVQFSSIEMKK